MKTFTPQQSRRQSGAIDRQDLSVVTESIDHVRRLLSPASMPAIEEITDFPAATRALKSAWESIDRALDGDLAVAAHVASSSDLLDLTVRLRRADKIVQRIENGR